MLLWLLCEAWGVPAPAPTIETRGIMCAEVLATPGIGSMAS